MRFTPNLVVGLVITGLGVLLTMDRVGTLNIREVLPYWPIALILFGASVVAQAFQRDEAPGQRPPRPIIGPGLVLVLVIVGLSLSHAYQRRADWARAPRPGTINVFALMGQDSRTGAARPFRGADVTTVMGNSRLDLRDSTLQPGEEATVDVFGMMGQVLLVVPEGWDVDVRTTPIMGGVRDLRWQRAAPSPAAADAPAAQTGDSPRRPPANAPRLVVRGFIMMGGLVIRS